jgi:hypothetical protein
MARDADYRRGISVADFCDSLSPSWLYERRTVQRKEVAAAFSRFAKIQVDAPVMVGDISEIIHDLIGTKTYRSSRAFVEHLRSIGPNHPMETTFKNAFESNQRNTADFLSGRLTQQMLDKVERLYIQGLLPATTPAGVSIDESTKRRFLASCHLTDFPAIALEMKTTRDNWTLRRDLNQNNFLDQLHIVALPYVDVFVTDDDKLSRLMKRSVEGVPFRTADILTKSAFDARFVLNLSPSASALEPSR